MLPRVVRLLVPGASAVFAVACAHSPNTVVHFSAPHDTSWEVRDPDGARLCSLPCTVELDERESVTVARADGKSEFLLRQERLGEGSFSASVHVRYQDTRGTRAARVFAAALSGAGSELAKSDDEKHAKVALVLSTAGAAIRAASDAAEIERDELWVERSATP